MRAELVFSVLEQVFAVVAIIVLLMAFSTAAHTFSAKPTLFGKVPSFDPSFSLVPVQSFFGTTLKRIH